MVNLDVQRTYGAILIGGILAFILSGIVTSQTFSYFKHYPDDQRIIKLLVSFIWAIDSCHTFFVAALLWDHFIVYYGDFARFDYIPWSMALTILCTAIVTMFVHGFFVYRIFKFSHHNYYITVPLGIVSVVRLCLAFITTIKMIQLRSITRFVDLYTWAFSSGLALCAVLDLIFTGCLCLLLRKNMKENSSMNNILGRLILYVLRNGILNCLVSIATLICWLTMSQYLIFLGIHFAISKLYANSVIMVFNARKDLHQTAYRSKGQNSDSGDRHQVIMYPAGTLGGLSKDQPSPSVDPQTRLLAADIRGLEE